MVHFGFRLVGRWLKFRLGYGISHEFIMLQEIAHEKSTVAHILKQLFFTSHFILF